MTGRKPPWRQHHRFLVADQLHQLGIEPMAIMLESVGRDTAPAVAMTALAAEDPDPVLLILPSDHVIGDDAAREAQERGADDSACAAEAGAFSASGHASSGGGRTLERRSDIVGGGRAGRGEAD